MSDKNYIKLAWALDDKNKYKDVVKKIVDSGYDINYSVPASSPDHHYQAKWQGYTLLHFVVEKQRKLSEYTPELDLLLQKKANFTCQNYNNFTPLRLAFEMLKIKYKFDSDSVSKCRYISKLLNAHVESNIVTNPRCDYGISHFHIACLANNLEVAELFLTSGVSVDEAINVDSSIFPGFTCLHLAVMYNHENMVKLLLKYNSNFMCLNAEGRSPVQMINDKQFYDDVGFNMKDSLLDHLLKLAKSNSNPFANKNLTLFHLLCSREKKFSTSKEWKNSLKNGIDINDGVSLDSPIFPGYTPLHFAAYCSLGTVTALLKKGANLMAKDAIGISPLDICCNRFKPSEISNILKIKTSYSNIRFQNDALLVDVLCSLDSCFKLEIYLKSADVNSSILSDSLLWPGFTLLHLAVMFARIRGDCARFCVEEKRADFTIKNQNNMTALHLAFYLKKWSCVDYMFKQYEFINRKLDQKIGLRSSQATTAIHIHSGSANQYKIDDNNVSHFHLACIHGSCSVAEMFLKSGVDVNMVVKSDLECRHYKRTTEKIIIRAGSTPLHIALAVGCDLLCDELCSLNLDLCIVDADGFTPIHRAFTIKPADSHSFYFRWQNMWFNKRSYASNPVAPGGLSHLHIACDSGNNFATSSAVEALIPLTNDINEPITSEVMKYVQYFPKHISLGDTPLHIAVKSKDEAKVVALLKNGANVKAKNADGLDPLHLSMLPNYDRDDITKHLIEKYNKIKLFKKTGFSDLHLAAYFNDSEAIKNLIENETDVNGQIKSDSPMWPGETPLSILIKKHRGKCNDNINLLLNHILKNNENSRPLHGSAKRQKVCLPESSFNSSNSEGLSAFHISCMGKDADIVESFIKFGVDINSPTANFASKEAGYTPLHFAVMYGDENIIELLCNYGADVNQENLYGDTPLHLAAEICPVKICAFLRTDKFNNETRNLFGETAMDLLCHKGSDVNYFLDLVKADLTSRLDFSTKMGLIIKLACTYSCDDFKSLISYIPNLTDVDDDGRNVINYFVEDNFHRNIYNRDAYVKNIWLLVKSGCELDLQDNEGKTALHHAVLLDNWNLRIALILNGADFNVVDSKGMTPYLYFLKSKDRDDIFYKLIAQYRLAGLYLHPMNIDGYMRYQESAKFELNSRKIEFQRNLLEMSKIQVTDSFTLRDLLTEKMGMKFFSLTRNERKTIIKYLNFKNLKKFYEWLPLFKMQRGRLLKRKKLLESTCISLNSLLNKIVCLPVPCLESILIHLGNEDWQNIIRAKSY